ncbi:MAG: PhoH family protein [Bacteroidales bacterium]|nr:PhoH family protein [Candidatus Hennigimonas equi]
MKKTVTLDPERTLEIYGPHNCNLQSVCNAFPELKVVARGSEIKLDGSRDDIERFCEALYEARGKVLGNDTRIGDVIVYSSDGKPIAARGKAQKEMVAAYDKNDLIFATGPAGTGKTYMAIALAVRALKNREIRRIILTRPAVEAGERLGFLPGDLKEKLDPYLQPLYDALEDMIPPKKLQDFIADGIVQIAPLAYMRGRTLSSAVAILDEAQNTNLGQLKMFLTRMGQGSKFIVTGDCTQIDLPRREDSGLLRGMEILGGVPGIADIRFSNADIVRHPLVNKIVKAFENY